MKSVFSIIAILLFLGPIASFSGTKPTLSDFDDIKVGMLKTEVIAELGSPYTSNRWKGKDRWEYHFYEKKGKIVVRIKKEVHFKNGKASYIGDPLAPKISAEEQDKINLAADLKALDDWEKHKQKAVDARREYNEWVQQLHNKDPDPEATVPRFKPVK